MIQRIQSVFLLLIIIILVILCSMHVLHLVYVEPGRQTTEYLMNLFYFQKQVNGVLMESNMQYLLIALTALIIGLSLFILFDFKNRLRQMKFTQINIAAVFALLVVFAVKAYLFVPAFSSDKMMMSSVIGIALFIFCQYLVVRVYFLIKKDEELVRSADRIR